MSEETHYKAVSRWHRERGLPDGTSEFGDVEYRKRRARLIAEEFCEAMEALGFWVNCEVIFSNESEDKGTDDDAWVYYGSQEHDPHPFAFLDALCDLGYVVEGSASELGWDYDEARRRVQASNDTKGKELDENGKLRKGDSYVPPLLGDLV